MKYTMRLTIIFLLYITGSILAEDASSISGNPPVDLKKIVHPGEKLTYLAKWTGFPAGIITARVWPSLMEFEGKKVFMFELSMEANDFLSTFYPVSSTMKSFTEADTGASLLFKRKAREGSYRANDRVIFDYNNTNNMGNYAPIARVQQIEGRNIRKCPSRPIPARVCDPLALAWSLRALPLNKKGDTANIYISDRYNSGIISFLVEGEEKLLLPGLGTFNCLVVKPEAKSFDGKESLIKTEGSAKFWLEKNTHILLRAEVTIPVGKASAALAAHKNSGLEKYAITETKPTEKPQP